MILSNYFLKKGLYIDSHSNISLTITKVELSSDLRYAKIFLTTINDAIDKNILIDYLNQRSKRYKFVVGKKIRIKKIPNLKFYYDKMFKIDLISAL